MKKFKRLLVIVIAAITVLSFAACSKSDSDDKNKNDTKENSTTAEQVNLNGKEYEGKGYTISLPDNWQKVTNAMTDLCFADQKSPDLSFPSSINIIVEDCSAYSTIQTSEDYMKAALMQFEGNKLFTVKDNNMDKCNGYDVAIVNLDATNGTVNYKCLQYYFVKNQKAYILSFSGDLNGGYESTLEQAEQIFSTFTFAD